MALAIQGTPWWRTGPRGAVPRPPPPRLVTRSPRARAYPTGPRLETTISFRRSGTGQGYPDARRRNATRRPPRRDGPEPRSGRRDDRELGALGVVPGKAVEEHE